MAVPKKKKSKSRCGHKNSHTGLKPINVSFDQNGDMHTRHRATVLKDGTVTYKGKVILQAKVKAKEASTD